MTNYFRNTWKWWGSNPWFTWSWCSFSEFWVICDQQAPQTYQRLPLGNFCILWGRRASHCFIHIFLRICRLRLCLRPSASSSCSNSSTAMALSLWSSNHLAHICNCSISINMYTMLDTTYTMKFQDEVIMINTVWSFYSKSFGTRLFTTFYDSSTTMTIGSGKDLTPIEQRSSRSSWDRVGIV